MATSPQEQRRRDLPWFRQISIPGLIYDGLFRDCDADERSKRERLNACLDMRFNLYVGAYLRGGVQHVVDRMW